MITRTASTRTAIPRNSRYCNAHNTARNTLFSTVFDTFFRHFPSTLFVTLLSVPFARLSITAITSALAMRLSRRLSSSP